MSAVGEDMDIMLGSRRRTRAALWQAVAEFAEERGWPVAQGAHLVRDGRGTHCSCGRVTCAAPGMHPADPRWSERATASPAAVRYLWSQWPDSTVVVPTGRVFDAISVPRQAGTRALVRLERMGTPLGPVLATPTGRVAFLVAPGAAAELPHLLYQMGWDDAVLDLRCHGEGDYVFAPPSPMGMLGPVEWIRPPESGDPALPEARLLLGTLAYACHRKDASSTGRGLWLAS
ncbi:bifunctional DNA primase/polymerase [Embleya sp. NPDC050154]|uniref:bifunctional DNA primase/polymerase n=1 Tax=unclassified Embleya TaxID=2699296 RepID=UPI00378C5C3F|nr:bifunctional DNA primase/polymerase [Embleya sp. NBC_00888]